jgi:hypothetical protein
MTSDSNKKILAIKRSDSESSIDELFGYTASDVENEGKIEGSNYDFTQLLETFENSLGHLHIFVPTDILNPIEINSFIFETRRFQDDISYSNCLSNFLGKLIQNSYLSGHNNFHLDLTNMNPPDSLMRAVECCEERPLRMTINGNVGAYFGSLSENIFAKIYGDCGYLLGNGSSNMNVEITGDVNFKLASSSNNFDGIINGDIAWDSLYSAIDGKIKVNGKCGANFAYCAKNLNATISDVKNLRDFCYHIENSQIKTENRNVIANFLDHLRSNGKYDSIFGDIDLKNSVFFNDDKSWQKYVRDNSNSNLYLHENIASSVIFICDDGKETEVIKFI